MLTNTGKESVVVVSVDKSCGCLDLAYPRQPLRPGEKADMELEFDARGISGWIYKTLVMKTSSAAGEHLIVVIADVE